MEEAVNWLDIVIIVLVGVLGFVGWRTGIIRAAATIAGLILGVYLAGQYHGQVGEVTGELISSENGAQIAAFAVVFLGAMVAAAVAGSVVRRVLKVLLLGWVDGLVGALLGVLVGLIVVSSIGIVVCRFPVGDADATVESSVLAKNLAPLTSGLVPEQFEDFIGGGSCGGGGQETQGGVAHLTSLLEQGVVHGRVVGPGPESEL